MTTVRKAYAALLAAVGVWYTTWDGQWGTRAIVGLVLAIGTGVLVHQVPNASPEL